MPSTFPRSSENDTPSTARTTPSSVRNLTCRSSTSSSVSAISSSPALGGTNPWIQVRVQEVDDRAEENDEERAVERHAHDRRQVEVPDRLRRVLAHAVQVEDRLRQDRSAAEHGGEIEAEQRHDRD